MERATRTRPHLRRQSVLEAAIRLSKEIGYRCITRDGVAARARTSSATIGRYFPTMNHLKDAVMAAAIEQEVIEIIAQGLSIADPAAIKINEQLKVKVMYHLSQINR